jgi:hypothetical protein
MQTILGNNCRDAATAAPSSPQLGGIVKAASRKKRQRPMKRNRANNVAVTLKRGDAGRCTAVSAQPPQLGGIVRAASRKKRQRPMKRDTIHVAAAVPCKRGDAFRRLTERHSSGSGSSCSCSHGRRRGGSGGGGHRRRGNRFHHGINLRLRHVHSRGGVRFVGLDLRAVCAPEVPVQRAKEVRFLGVHVDRGSFVLGQAVGIGG